MDTSTSQNAAASPFAQSYFHGTRAQLHIGDLISPGYQSNYGEGHSAAYVFLTSTLDAAIWGAELSKGEGPGRIYLVEPTGPIEDDPDLTDRKFPGNPTQSYRSQHPLRIIGEIIHWQGHPDAQVETMKNHLDKLHQSGVRSLNENP